jgi:hypothetical protein
MDLRAMALQVEKYWPRVESIFRIAAPIYTDTGIIIYLKVRQHKALPENNV